MKHDQAGVPGIRGSRQVATQPEGQVAVIVPVEVTGNQRAESFTRAVTVSQFADDHLREGPVAVAQRDAGLAVGQAEDQVGLAVSVQVEREDRLPGRDRGHQLVVGQPKGARVLERTVALAEVDKVVIAFAGGR